MLIWFPLELWSYSYANLCYRNINIIIIIIIIIII